MQELRLENENLHKQIQAMAANHETELKMWSERPSESVRCSKCERLQRVQMLIQEDTFDAFQNIAEEDWRDEVFPKIRIQQGHIWEAPLGYALIFPCAKDISTNDKEIRKAIDKFGGQEGLKRQNKSKGEVAVMRLSLGFPGEGETFIHSTRAIYYPIITDGGVNEAIDDENIFKSLKTVKTQMLKHHIAKVAIPEIGGITGLVTTRMIQFLFADSNVEIVAYKPNDGRGAGIPNRASGNNTEGTNRKIKKPKHEALLRKINGKSYSDLLNVMKETINPSQIGVDVKEIKKT